MTANINAVIQLRKFFIESFQPVSFWEVNTSYC